MSYSRRLAICESFEIREINGEVVLEITPSAFPTPHRYVLAPIGTPAGAIALELEHERVTALRSDDYT